MFRFIFVFHLVAKSHKRLIGKTSTVQRYKNQCKIEIFLEIKRFRDSLRYKTAVMIKSTATQMNHTPPVPRGQSAKSSKGGEVMRTASAK